jgi:CRP-like cAMP-binding protein
MRAEKKATIDIKFLQELVPLNALSPERFRDVSEKIIIEEVMANHYLFRKGDRDNQSIYLLEGKVNLIDGFRKVTNEVEAKTDTSRYAMANQQPRHLSARAVKKCVIARVDSGMLDLFLTWDQSCSAVVVEIGAVDNQDWMTRILQTEAFSKIPPVMIQSLLLKMQKYPVEAGEVVIQQGEPGDYFYTIHDGRCIVSRKDSPNAEAQFLAELCSGASFGEDALVSYAKRNATVTMLTNGLLMRLAKEDFTELLKNQLVKRVDFEQAAAMVDEGAVWVDVRTADEYECGSVEDSVNIPLSNLRDEITELVFNTKYIICCDTGRRSESAGFILSHKGFDVYVLEGGIPATSPETPPADTSGTGMTAAQDEELALLRVENEKLLVEISENQSAEARLKEQIEQQRGELCELAEKLSSLYSQVQSDAVVMLQQQDQFAALQEHHADVVDALKLEIEQLKKQLSECQSQVETTLEEYSVSEQATATQQEI